MAAAQRLLYWIVALGAVGAWTSFIMRVSNQPLAVEIALGAMGLVACAWGHSVLFPAERPPAEPVSPGRSTREAALAEGDRRLGVGAPRATVGRPFRRVATAPSPPGEAARAEARRLGGALAEAGLRAPVRVRLEGDGGVVVTSLREPVGVRVSAAAVGRYAANLAGPPARDVAGSLAGHLNEMLPG